MFRRKFRFQLQCSVFGCLILADSTDWLSRTSLPCGLNTPSNVREEQCLHGWMSVQWHCVCCNWNCSMRSSRNSSFSMLDKMLVCVSFLMWAFARNATVQNSGSFVRKPGNCDHRPIITVWLWRPSNLFVLFTLVVFCPFSTILFWAYEHICK